MAYRRRLGLISAGLVLGLLLACGAKPARLSMTPAMTPVRCAAVPGFVFVPAGDYLAGSDRAERDYGYAISAAAIAETATQSASIEQRLRQQGWFEAEAERHRQSLPAFCMQANLVTQQDYAAFVAATGHRPPGISAADYQAQGFLVHPYAAVKPYLWQNGMIPPGQEEHPVVLVSYEDALAYADWRGQQEGVVYRLPTAAEWEKAARGTDGRYFPWGNQWRDHATQWGQSLPAGTSPVGRYPLSRGPYGSEDMAGNVFEFTATLRQAQGSSVAVMKGCSWDDLPGFCRAAYVHTRPIHSRHILFGFRLVMAAASRPS